MKDKINVAELLRNCPKGMELDCYLFNGLEFDHFDTDNESYPIVCRAKSSGGAYNIHTFTKYGWYSAFFDYSKCVIFPKGKTTWEGFVPPCQFKDGDIVSTRNGIWIGIVKKPVNCVYETYITINGESLMYDNPTFCFERFATEEEKAKLFQAIKDNGFRWNAETKTLEKLIELKFKVGDRVKSKISQYEYTIVDIRKDVYIMYYANDKYGYHVPFCDEDKFDLVSNKFDITTLKPFDKVLARDTHRQIWIADLFSHKVKEQLVGYKFACIGHYWHQCIPYKGNEHLLGTTDDCDDFYKTWK